MTHLFAGRTPARQHRAARWLPADGERWTRDECPLRGQIQKMLDARRPQTNWPHKQLCRMLHKHTRRHTNQLIFYKQL